MNLNDRQITTDDEFITVCIDGFTTRSRRCRRAGAILMDFMVNEAEHSQRGSGELAIRKGLRFMPRPRVAWWKTWNTSLNRGHHRKAPKHGA